MARFRAAAAEAVRLEPLDALMIAYDRRSGITHVLGSPATEILGLLAAEALDRDQLFARLAEEFDLVDGDAELLDARLAELEGAGLIARS